jgi:hypothetical protein
MEPCPEIATSSQAISTEQHGEEVVEDDEPGEADTEQ